MSRLIGCLIHSKGEKRAETRKRERIKLLRKEGEEQEDDGGQIETAEDHQAVMLSGCRARTSSQSDAGQPYET